VVNDVWSSEHCFRQCTMASVGWSTARQQPCTPMYCTMYCTPMFYMYFYMLIMRNKWRRDNSLTRQKCIQPLLIWIIYPDSWPFVPWHSHFPLGFNLAGRRAPRTTGFIICFLSADKTGRRHVSTDLIDSRVSGGMVGSCRAWDVFPSVSLCVYGSDVTPTCP